MKNADVSQRGIGIYVGENFQTLLCLVQNKILIGGDGF
jgi:hypothetical protein